MDSSVRAITHYATTVKEEICVSDLWERDWVIKCDGHLSEELNSPFSWRVSPLEFHVMLRFNHLKSTVWLHLYSSDNISNKLSFVNQLTTCMPVFERLDLIPDCCQKELLYLSLCPKCYCLHYSGPSSHPTNPSIHHIYLSVCPSVYLSYLSPVRSL